MSRRLIYAAFWEEELAELITFLEANNYTDVKSLTRYKELLNRPEA